MEAVPGGNGRPLSAREEELLGLLASFPDGGGGEYSSDRELSFSDLVEAGATRPGGTDQCAAAAPREDRGSAAPSSPAQHEAAWKQTQQRAQAAARERRQRRQRSGGGRGSCGGGGDGAGVLLNFYVPGLLTRSMTAPRPGRGALSPGAVQGSPAKAAAAGKARTQAPLAIGCWPALWGRGRDRRRPAKVCS